MIGPSGYFYGWAVYQDPFPGTNYHLTEFGYEIARYPVHFQENETMAIAPEWHYLAGHSCFDEDCKNYKQRLDDVIKWENTFHK